MTEWHAGRMTTAQRSPAHLTCSWLRAGRRPEASAKTELKVRSGPRPDPAISVPRRSAADAVIGSVRARPSRDADLVPLTARRGAADIGGPD
jgi:hypothetical protein